MSLQKQLQVLMVVTKDKLPEEIVEVIEVIAVKLVTSYASPVFKRHSVDHNPDSHSH